jgi:hypothetical protein
VFSWDLSKPLLGLDTTTNITIPVCGAPWQDPTTLSVTLQPRLLFFVFVRNVEVAKIVQYSPLSMLLSLK